MKYKRFKKLPLKQKVIILIFWNGIIILTISFYTYFAAKIIEKILK